LHLNEGTLIKSIQLNEDDFMKIYKTFFHLGSKKLKKTLRVCAKTDLVGKVTRECNVCIKFASGRHKPREKLNLRNIPEESL
jgi:hypothetical protein